MKSIHKLGLTLGVALAGVMLAQGLSNASDKSATPTTFTRDVAPIIQKNCVACHRPGQVAPMSFLSYKEVRPWARAIKEKVVTREMPPWYADPHHGEFANDRRLSQKDIDTIVAWADTGAKEGDPKAMPPNPTFADQTWAIGKPDIVLPMTVEYSIPADGTIEYKYFIVPTNFAEDMYVRAVEIRRGNPSVVHHVIVSVREPGQGPLPPAGELNLANLGRRGGAESGGGEGGGGNIRRGNNPDGMLIGWAPGMMPLVLPPGKAKLVKKGSVLIFQMHYTTNGVPATDRTSVGLVFAKSPVEKRVITTGASARVLVIPPGDPNYESTSSFTFKEDSHILNFMPHMHLRGKDFEYRLVYPDGTSKVLLRVPKYNFNWQITYWLKEPAAAPKGSKLECVAHHDNSVNNKYNPDPSVEVRWGQQTWDEMMIGWFDYTIDAQNLRQETAELGRKMN